MFYTLSKALLFIIQPSFWLFCLVVLSFISRSSIKRKRLRWLAFGLFLFFGNNFLYEKVISTLEWNKTPLANESYEYGVILGGYGEYNTIGEGIELFRSADRLTEAVALYGEGKINKLLISSGVHEEGHPEHNEAKITSDLLMRMGIPQSDIVLEQNSWNTYQNAMMTKELLGERDTEILLITSAFHMNRAKACFEKQGFKVVPYPVDFIADNEPRDWTWYVIPSFRTLTEWQIPLKEWVGTIVYRTKGYL